MTATTLEYLKALETAGIVKLDPGGSIRWDSRPGQGCPKCGGIDHRYIEVKSGRLYRTCDEHRTEWPTGD